MTRSIVLAGLLLMGGATLDGNADVVIYEGFDTGRADDSALHGQAGTHSFTIAAVDAASGSYGVPGTCECRREFT